MTGVPATKWDEPRERLSKVTLAFQELRLSWPRGFGAPSAQQYWRDQLDEVEKALRLLHSGIDTGQDMERARIEAEREDDRG